MVAHGHITMLLSAAGRGDADASAELLPLVYDELRSLAKSHLGPAAARNTLQPTALVHEAYLKLIGKTDTGWNGRGHFFGAAANAMRQILVDQARRKHAVKHGGGRARVDFGDIGEPAAEDSCDESGVDILGLDAALAELEQIDERKARVVMLRFFAGLTTPEVAEVLGISVPTVDREWRFARSFLHRRLRGAGMEHAA